MCINRDVFSDTSGSSLTMSRSGPVPFILSWVKGILVVLLGTFFMWTDYTNNFMYFKTQVMNKKKAVCLVSKNPLSGKKTLFHLVALSLYSL